MIPKFRAWDKYTNDIVKIHTIDLETDGSIGCVVDYRVIHLDMSECVLMQSTGLKDKNGVEIYEGDVVLLNVNNGFDYVDNEAFVVQKSLYHSGLVCADPRSEMEYRIFNKDSVGGYSYEVIGNIYANPGITKGGRNT